jgi:hypothetical protein
MTWKIWVISVIIALAGGFYMGTSMTGHKLAAKASAAEQKVAVLNNQVQTDFGIKHQQEQDIAAAQARADTADAKVKKLMTRYKPTPPPVTVPGSKPPVPAPVPMPDVVDDSNIKDQIIIAQANEIVALQDVNAKLKLDMATNNDIITKQQQELNLREIALKAQEEGNRAAVWKGGIRGGGAVAVVALVAHAFFHF